MLRMGITIPSEVALILRELAEQERRTVGDQAAVLLIEELGRRERNARRRRAVQDQTVGN